MSTHSRGICRAMWGPPGDTLSRRGTRRRDSGPPLADHATRRWSTPARPPVQHAGLGDLLQRLALGRDRESRRHRRGDQHEHRAQQVSFQHLRPAPGLDEGSEDRRRKEARSLTKLTLAPALAAGTSFFARPELRLFTTFAFWNE